MKVHGRTIVWGGEVENGLAEEFTHAFLRLDRDKEPITIVCSGSSGGDYDEAAAGMMDLILFSENKVVTVGYGLNASCAALIFLCGDERLLYPRSLLLFHNASLTSEDQNFKEYKKLATIVEKQMEHDIDLLVSRSCKPPTYWQERLDSGDVYIWPHEALDLELATAIFE